MKLRQTKIMNEKIFIKTNRIGFIPQLGIQGPIVNPYPTTRKVAKDMIVSGIQVFQITEDKQVIELNLQNVFPGEGDSVKPEKKEEKPSKPIGEPVKPVEFKGIPNSSKEPVESKPQTDNKEDKTETQVVSNDESKEVQEDGPSNQPQKNNQKNFNKNNKNKNNK